MAYSRLGILACFTLLSVPASAEGFCVTEDKVITSDMVSFGAGIGNAILREIFSEASVPHVGGLYAEVREEGVFLLSADKGLVCTMQGIPRDTWDKALRVVLGVDL